MSAASHNGMNVSFKEVVSNIDENIRGKPLPFLRVQNADYIDPDGRPTILLAGGPSINHYLRHVRLLQSKGCTLYTVNGAYKWALENGLRPDNMVMVDARAENTRFVDVICPHTQYLMATQVHPAVIEQLPASQVCWWHNAASSHVTGYIQRHYGSTCVMPPIKGGNTVTLRSIGLLYYLGVRRVAVFGLDCSFDTASHAYAQQPDGTVMRVRAGNRVYRSTPWMVAQIRDFFRTMKMYPKMQVLLHGDTLLSRTVIQKNTLPNVQVYCDE